MPIATYINAEPFALEIRTMRLALAFFFSALVSFQAAATEVAWAKLAEGGHTILLANANTTGTYDPGNFRLDDCSTQRNLSDQGRQQAQRIGARLAARAIKVDVVLTSEWCRAMDTAKLAFPNTKIIAEPLLNPFLANSSNRNERAAAIRKLIGAFEGSGNQVLVTHEVNILALTGVAPREGEAIIVDAWPTGIFLSVEGRQLFD
jgi:hypothetical protein